MASLEKLILCIFAPGHRVRRASLLMVEVLAGDERGRIFADCEPNLRSVPLIEVIRSARAAHPGGHPSWFEGIGKHVRPTTSHGEGDQHVMQFALGIGLRSPPGPLRPYQVMEIQGRAPVHAGTQVYKPLRL